MKYVLLLGLVWAAGCGSEPDPVLLSGADVARATADFDRSASIPLPYAASPGDQRAQLDELRDQARLLHTLGDLAEPVRLPAAADLETLRRFSRQHAGRPGLAMAEQTIAYAILYQVLPARGARSYRDVAPAVETPEAQAAAAYAVDLLVRTRNPNADLIERALDAAGPAVSRAYRERAWQAARAAAADWLARPCASCQVDGPMGSEPGARRAAIEAAIRVPQS